MMPIAKRARVDRAQVVKKEVLFHEAMGLVQVHHSGHLNSFEADRKEVQDAAIARLYRAYAIVKAFGTQHTISNWSDRRADGGDSMNRMRLRREAQRDGVLQIREFEPELVPELVDMDAEYEIDEDGNYHDNSDIFQSVRYEYHRYTQSIWNKAADARLYHAWTLLKACDNEGTEADILNARISTIRQISEFASDFFMTTPHCRIASAEYTTAAVYKGYNRGIRHRLRQMPSKYESIDGETSRVRHLEAHQLAVYVQEESNRHYDIHGRRNEAEHIAHLPRLADLVVERIKSFAPELIVAGNSETRILRVIADAAWAA
jgi:hypothetical protein